MEVDAPSFPYHLLGLFINISEADFVSFDLELSGIPSRLPNKPPRAAGRLTLADRYAETKAGADRYQILQVGLTCAKFDYIEKKYVLRPYNINISPLLDERLDFEREISFQSGACTFLLNNGFDLGAPFAKGVQYLSREEAVRAKRLAYDRIDKVNPTPDLQLKDTDTQSLDFVRRCRDAITAWQKYTSTSLKITSSTGLAGSNSVCAISRFEKRLVHQLVRAEFPSAVAIGRTDCIRIVHFDPVREADNTRRIKSRVKEQIARQTGFRWVFEALVSGEIDGDALYIARSAAGVDGRDRFDRAIERLRKRKPVLVGHNMFTDIVYLYRTFVGPLPDTLDEFLALLHKLFPKIVDTKYLATHEEGDLNASPTLEEIAKSLQNQPLPNIATHEDHSKYNEKEAFHEAGYDSLLTATIMLRLSAKLGAERSEQDEQNKQIEQTERSEPSNSTTSSPPPPAHTPSEPDGGIALPTSDGENTPSPVSVPPLSSDFVPAPTTGKKTRKSKKRSKSKSKSPNNNTGFTSTNPFATLDALILDSPPSPTPSEPTTTTTEQPNWANEIFTQDTTGWVSIPALSWQRMERIPDFGDMEFWGKFGNRVRVFGTVEREVGIATWPVST
jgi:poly(A)-specific ribonuclease